jgi:hypothetical protein
VNPNPNANRIISLFPRTVNNLYATWDLWFLFPVVDLTFPMTHADGFIEAKIDEVDKVQLHINAISFSDVSPLKDIVNLLQIYLGCCHC